MLALPGTSGTKTEPKTEQDEPSTHNAVEASYGDESDTSSSSSSSSFSPELSLLASHDPAAPVHPSPGHHNNSKSPRTSNKPGDSSSSSDEEDVPFLASVFNSKEFTNSKRKSPSQTSKTSSRGPVKETREIGVQASLDLEEAINSRRSGRKKKGLNNSYNAHRLVSELAAQSNRSKSAGNY